MPWEPIGQKENEVNKELKGVLDRHRGRSVAYLDYLKQQIIEWEQRNFPNTPDYRNLLGMGEELGELFHAHLKGEQKIRQSPLETKIKKKDSIGDLLIYAINYCYKNDLCLLNCLESAWVEVKQRDWIKFPKNGRTE